MCFFHKSFDKLRIKKAENANVSGREKILEASILPRVKKSQKNAPQPENYFFKRKPSRKNRLAARFFNKIGVNYLGKANADVRASAGRGGGAEGSNAWIHSA